MISDTFIYINKAWRNPVVISKSPIRHPYAYIILCTRQDNNELTTRVIKINGRYYNPSIIVDIDRDITILLLGAIPINFVNRLTTTVNTTVNTTA